MKKVVILMVFLLAAGYCAMPLTTVSAITITLADQAGNKITANARATFLDEDGHEIVDVSLGQLPSWDNNIHWWAHSEHDTSLLRPRDARRTRFAIIRASGCGPVRIPISLTPTYNPPSIMPHGGGPAYMYYEFHRSVALKCGPDVDDQAIEDMGADASGQ